MLLIWNDFLASNHGQQPDIFEEFINIVEAIFKQGIFNVTIFLVRSSNNLAKWKILACSVANKDVSFPEVYDTFKKCSNLEFGTLYANPILADQIEHGIGNVYQMTSCSYLSNLCSTLTHSSTTMRFLDYFERIMKRK